LLNSQRHDDGIRNTTTITTTTTTRRRRVRDHCRDGKLCSQLRLDDLHLNAARNGRDRRGRYSSPFRAVGSPHAVYAQHDPRHGDGADEQRNDATNTKAAEEYNPTPSCILFAGVGGGLRCRVPSWVSSRRLPRHYESAGRKQQHGRGYANKPMMRNFHGSTSCHNDTIFLLGFF
jgi:hypothetical protein